MHVSDGFTKKVWIGGWGEFYPVFTKPLAHRTNNQQPRKKAVGRVTYILKVAAWVVVQCIQYLGLVLPTVK